MEMEQTMEQTIEQTMEKLKFIDLFCGIGGFHQALKTFNTNCVLKISLNSSINFFLNF